MPQIGKIKIRNLKELQEDHVSLTSNPVTPLRERKNIKSYTTDKKIKENKHDNETVIGEAIATTNTLTKLSKKRCQKPLVKETPCNQRYIDSYFTSCPKKYSNFDGKLDLRTTTKSKGENETVTTRTKAGRKRLFTDGERMSVLNSINTNAVNVIESITINSDSEDENNNKDSADSVETVIIQNSEIAAENKTALNDSLATTASSLSFGQILSLTSCAKTKSIAKTSSCSKVTTTSSKRKPKPCPPYKIIEDTTFAVDAFQFGRIENVTHYFLTHFHADHYIGMTKSFSMPLYVSPITARLIRAFIKVEEQYINELQLNEPCIINGIEVTALDANHCPGSILLVFRFLNTGKCILHTGDFRASQEMESEPIFWNNDIHTIYLDTTYISDKYAFCTQYESIVKAEVLIEKFLDKHINKRVLFICGSYVVGKEKFWASLAEKYELKVWAEGNRSTALKAINDERFNRLTVEDPHEANMHVIPMGKLSYFGLVEYIKLYEERYDIFFAIRPSGWEKDSKPRYSNKINLIGVEYSEHSSYEEMQRFVKFLKPEKVISTVPSSRDLMKTSKVPLNWYKYDKLKPCSKYQPTIDSFLCGKVKNTITLRLSNSKKSSLEHLVKSENKSLQKMKNSFVNEKAISVISSKPAEAKQQAKELKERVKKPRNESVITKKIAKPTTTAASITNSSELFEKSDLVLMPKKPPNSKRGKSRSKTKLAKKPLQQKNVCKKTAKLNTNELSEISEKSEEPPRPYVSEDEINILSLKTPTSTNEQCKQIRRTTRSQKSLTKSTFTSTNSKEKDGQTSTASSSKQTKTKSLRRSADSHSNDMRMTTKYSTEAHENKAKEQDVSKSRKRNTRSKSILNETTTYSSKTQTQNVKKELLLPTDQNNEQLNCSTKSHNTQENHPLGFPTAIVTTAQALPKKSLRNKNIEMNSSTSSADCLTEFDCRKKSLVRKRQALSHSLTSLKRVKSSFDSSTILKTILEQNEAHIDGINCSQLAGLVLETVNKHNPDYSKDHIPADLLSDADDDWM